MDERPQKPRGPLHWLVAAWRADKDRLIYWGWVLVLICASLSGPLWNRILQRYADATLENAIRSRQAR